MTTDLDARLRALPTIENRLPASAIVARARARTLRNRTGAALALAAAALAGVAVWAGRAEDVRARGVDLAPAVVLEAAVDGPEGPRPLDGPLGPDEAVVFRVRAGGPGTLVIAVDGAPIWPEQGPWTVGAGSVWVGADRPLAWTPDGPRGTHTATATLCPAPDAPPSSCSTSSVVVHWAR